MAECISNFALKMKNIIKLYDISMEEMKLPIALGRKLNGEQLIQDLTKLPHLLISGQSGYGKSNLLVNIIEDLISSHAPEDLNFLLIDTKMVEFFCLKDKVKDYLYQPIAVDKGEAYTDVKDSYNVISELCGEMENRCMILKRNRCRSIEEYNSKTDCNMPYIVLIIDEYADLVYFSSQFKYYDDEKDIDDDFEEGDEEDEEEDNDDCIRHDTFLADICRLGQIGRIVGIHIILSTQRPTYNVISGFVKSMFHARISFKVPDRKYSSTILDRTGAELLQSPGDFIWSYGLEFEFAHAPLNPWFT